MADSDTERRKYKRHPVSEGRLIVCSHGSNHLLTMKNISAGGLQFVYFPDTCEAPDCRSINIMQNVGDYFSVAGISCRIVYDIPCMSEDFPFNGIRTWVVGVDFSCLNKKQKDKLLRLIYAMLNF